MQIKTITVYKQSRLVKIQNPNNDPFGQNVDQWKISYITGETTNFGKL